MVDFINDMLLDRSDLILVDQLQVVVYLLAPVLEKRGAFEDQKASQRLVLTRENLRAVVRDPMPRRKDCALLHVAAEQGADRHVKKVIYAQIVLNDQLKLP